MQHSRPTLAFKPLILFPPTSHLLPLYPDHRLMFLAVLLYLLLPFLSLAPSEFFNRMLEISEPGALNYYPLSRLILLTLFVSSNLTLIHIPLSRFPNSLLSDLIASTCSLAFSLPIPRTLAAASSPFSSGRAYLSMNSLPPLFALPYSDYVGVNISLNNSSSLSFLNVYAT